MPSDVRYWVAGNQAFGYTPHRQQDGKFYALKYKYDSKLGRGSLIKKRAFGRRKKAKETAYHWFCQRRAVLEKLRAAQPVKAAPTKAEILQKKIDSADAHIKRHEKRLKLLKTLIKKWERRKKSWERQLESMSKILFLRGGNLRVKVYVEMKVSMPYLVDIEDPRNTQQIRAALILKNPSDWETDPSFYDNLGSNWLHSIDETKDFAPSCPKCGHPIEVVSTMSDCYILGCPVHREFDKTFPL